MRLESVYIGIRFPSRTYWRKNLSAEVRDLVQRFMPNFPVRHCGKIYTDTSEFMAITYGDVIRLGGLHYMVLRDESERRFGLEDPKYWVKRTRAMETGNPKIIKLVFHESFPLKIGDFTLQCHRSPEKEARILMLVKDDFRFMQGISHNDDAHNNVRVIDLIRGKRLDEVVDAIEADHETYFHEYFPDILERFIGSCEAIGFLHSRWEKHGDIRRDHLWVEHSTGRYMWIDFDYAFDFHENPFGLDIFGLGNILLFLTGKRIRSLDNLAESGFGPEVAATLTPEDFSIMFPYRIVNLRKLYPYIPIELNRVLMHFAAGSFVFYDSVVDFLEELRPCVRLLR